MHKKGLLTDPCSDFDQGHVTHFKHTNGALQRGRILTGQNILNNTTKVVQLVQENTSIKRHKKPKSTEHQNYSDQSFFHGHLMDHIIVYIAYEFAVKKEVTCITV